MRNLLAQKHGPATGTAWKRRLRSVLRVERLEDRCLLSGLPFMVQNINQQNFFSGPSDMVAVGSTSFYVANDGIHGTELWKSDGTAAGTVMVKDINPGSYNSSNPTGLVNVNGTLFFSASDGTHGQELWKSDGTTAGTVMVSDINAGSGSAYPTYLTNVNGTLFFKANDGTNGPQLWKSDGTAAGTVMVKNINPGGDSRAVYLTNVNGTLYFVASDATHGKELWKSDGTTAGTAMVEDIYPGNFGSYPTSFAVSGGHLFFAADDGIHGVELWDPAILPAPGSGTLPAPQEMSTSNRVSTTGSPLSWQRQDMTPLLADQPPGSAPAQAADHRPTHILDQVFAQTVNQPAASVFELSLGRLRHPKRQEDFALGWPLG